MYTCCPSYEGEPHTDDCPAVAEVRRQDAEFRAECEGLVTDHPFAIADRPENGECHICGRPATIHATHMWLRSDRTA